MTHTLTQNKAVYLSDIALFHQPIRVQAAPGSVQTAILHVFEMDAAAANISEKRVCAMHQRNPMHTFMFDSNGKLLDANQGALEAFQQDQAGRRSQEQETP